jgi:AcrR family transcriptional regulator
VTLHGKQVKDRRIVRTESLLRQALVSLIREKNYDSIVVKEILDRANVGRSTFYSHFRDKDDLLVSGIQHILGSPQSKKLHPTAKPYEKIIWFSVPILQFHDEHRHAAEAGMGPRGRAVAHEHLRQVLAELIADDVRKGPQGRQKTADQIPPDLLVEYITSTFILVLNWWVESQSPLPAKEINEVFRALVLPTLAAASV